jgi:hypothetical protein
VRRRIYIVAAFIFAGLATVVGWSQSLIYKDTPLSPLALWFPIVVLTRATDLAAVALSLIQFPLFAVGFTFGIRRWPVSRVLAALMLTYALLAGFAFAIVRSR